MAQLAQLARAWRMTFERRKSDASKHLETMVGLEKWLKDKSTMIIIAITAPLNVTFIFHVLSNQSKIALQIHANSIILSILIHDCLINYILYNRYDIAIWYHACMQNYAKTLPSGYLT